MYRRNTYIFAALILIAVLFPRTSQAFGISPAVKELSGNRGAIVEGSLTVLDKSLGGKDYFVRMFKFAPRDESGTPEFIQYDVDHSGLPEWTVFNSEMVTTKDGVAEVNYKIYVPADVAAGSYYGGIVVSDIPFNVVGKLPFNVMIKIAGLVLLNVNGDNNLKGELLDFTSTLQGKVTSSVNGEFIYRVQNQGNIYFAPTGFVEIKDIFGRTILKKDANLGGGRVLPPVLGRPLAPGAHRPERGNPPHEFPLPGRPGLRSGRPLWAGPSRSRERRVY